MTADQLEAALTELVGALPDLPEDRLRALAAAYRALAPATPAAAALAGALAAVLDRYVEGAAPPEGWALVASAGHTLAQALAGGVGAPALDAARFEIDSLAAPASPRPAAAATPDVPATSLRRRT